MLRFHKLKSKLCFVCLLPRIYVSIKSWSAFFVLCLVCLYFSLSSSWSSFWSLHISSFLNSSSLHSATFSTSSSSTSHSIPSSFDSSSSSFLPPTPIPSSYLTYLPHSGWHNQRIALENALTLSLLLNRSLVLPPLLLPTLPWHPKLIHQLKVLPSTAFQSWSTVFNLSLFPILLRSPCPPSWVLSNTHRYGYQYTDDPEWRRSPPDPPFLHSLWLHQLNEAPYVQLGSLFGSQRLKLTQPKHLEIQVQVQTQLTRVLLTNETKSKIQHEVQQLGGPNEFVSLHIRGKDIVFAKRLNELVFTILQRLRPYHDQLCKTVSLFLATDLPSTSASLTPLYQKYPCLYQLTNASFFMDMYIASESQFFLGTHGSTFSKFIQRLWWVHHCHQVLPHDVKCRKQAALV